MMVVMPDILIRETVLLLEDTLLCNSPDLIENLSPGQSTTYCQFSGNKCVSTHLHSILCMHFEWFMYTKVPLLRSLFYTIVK